MRRILLPLLIIIIAVAGVWYVNNNAPKPKKRPAPPPKGISVETQKIIPKPFEIKLNSFGQIEAKNTTILSSQVSGRVTSINPLLEEGAFFTKGDLLLTIDNKDYQSAINSAKANLVRAQQAVVLEEAEVKQAKADWKRLNPTKKAPALVSRTPQILSAKADVSEAHAAYNDAILNFKRTKIEAPFDGRVITKQVSIGDFVDANTELASIISTQTLQVRLGLKNSDLPFIDLPEQNVLQSKEESKTNQELPNVEFESDLFSLKNSAPQIWKGKIVRTEASIDDATQQLFIIGEIEQPYAPKHSDKHPLKIGQYVNANIQGKKLPNAIVINIDNIYQGQFVLTVRDGIIRRQDIEILWQNDEIALINQGLSAGDILITSILSEDADGSPARLAGAPPKKKGNKKERPKGDKTN